MATSAPLNNGTSSAATCQPMLLDAASKKTSPGGILAAQSQSRQTQRTLYAVPFIIFFIKPVRKYYLHDEKFKQLHFLSSAFSDLERLALHPNTVNLFSIGSTNDEEFILQRC